jgi:hypothetical protein
VKVLEFDLFTGATNEDAPSRTAGFIDVVDLEGNIVFDPQSAYFGSILRTEDDAMTSEGIVDRNCCWSQVVHIDEPSDGLLPEQRETLVRRQVFEGSPCHGQSVSASTEWPLGPKTPLPRLIDTP